MANLTGIAAIALMGHAIAEEAAAHATAQGNDHEVLHTVSGTKGMFAKCHDIGIIGQGHGQAQTVAQHGGQRDGALPRQIGRVFDTTGLNVSARSTDTDRTDILIAAIRLHQSQDMLA